jgi:DNA-binding transcriptional ArsR family regulator
VVVGNRGELYDSAVEHEPCTDMAIAEYSRKLKVCGHPLRLKLLCTIADVGEPCVSELWECLNQPQPIVSQHLAVLKHHGIVEATVKGNRRIYRIVDPFFEHLVAFLGTHAGNDADALILPFREKGEES